MTEKHNCEENRTVKCDGEIHTHFCTICKMVLGESECPEKGAY